MSTQTERLIETIRSSIIGDNEVIETPFGPRRVTYADYTASGRSLSFIEDFLRDEVMPFYANTHTESSGTGRQTTRFREDARKIIHEALGCGPDDVVLFCGTGATGAIDRLIDILNLRIPNDLDARYGFSEQIPAEERPVVFIGPYEHHSNELPWRESIAEVVTIDEDLDGRIDLAELERELQRYADRPLKIGSFSAASNVTGIGSDTRNTTALLHRYGALSFWDFAAAAPYVKIEMNMRDDEPGGDMLAKDAIFISTHKFIGGPGTPGLLIAKRHLFKNKVPAVPGGGTVYYVNEKIHRYIEKAERREEGGTPPILEAIRAGLVFQLKEAVGHEYIREREVELTRRAIEAWSQTPNLEILGNKDAWRLSIVSFVVKHADGYLHHNFIVALLNDLFGLQSRGGCSCAGPYAHRLLGIDFARTFELEEQIAMGCEGIRPGWVRVNFNYFLADGVADYIIRAVSFVAEHGWKLLPYYRFDAANGRWNHREGQPKARMSLQDLSYRSGKLEYRALHMTEPEWALDDYLEQARALVEAAPADAQGQPKLEDPKMPEQFEAMRWFPMPGEVLSELQGHEQRPLSKSLIDTDKCTGPNARPEECSEQGAELG